MKNVTFVWALLIAVFALCSSGCASMRVKPWDRDLLAEPAMRFSPQPMEQSIDEHIYFSKEGSTGWLDVAGGGCGCN